MTCVCFRLEGAARAGRLARRLPLQLRSARDSARLEHGRRDARRDDSGPSNITANIRQANICYGERCCCGTKLPAAVDDDVCNRKENLENGVNSRGIHSRSQLRANVASVPGVSRSSGARAFAKSPGLHAVSAVCPSSGRDRGRRVRDGQQNGDRDPSDVCAFICFVLMYSEILHGRL